MKLYFVYGNKQKKKLAESDYADDIYDVIISFFEDHNSFPHIITLCKNQNDAMVEIPNTLEHFLICDITDEQYEELDELVADYKR